MRVGFGGDVSLCKYMEFLDRGTGMELGRGSRMDWDRGFSFAFSWYFEGLIRI